MAIPSEVNCILPWNVTQDCQFLEERKDSRNPGEKGNSFCLCDYNTTLLPVL